MNRLKSAGADGAVVGNRLIAPAPPDVGDLHRGARRDLLLDADTHVPAVLPNVPTVEDFGIVGLEDHGPAEVLVEPGPALAVGRRVHQVAIGTVVASARVPDREGGGVIPIARRIGGDAERRLLEPAVGSERVVGGRIPPQAELERRLAVAKHVVRRAEPRVDVFRTDAGVLRRKAQRRRQKPIGDKGGLRVVAADVLEANASLQRQAPGRPLVLGIKGGRVHLERVVGPVVCVHRQRHRERVAEVVGQSLVVEIGDERRISPLLASAGLEAVRARDVRKRPAVACTSSPSSAPKRPCLVPCIRYPAPGPLLR